MKVSKSAAQQIKQSAEAGKVGDMVLRVAATQKEDGGIEYGMGFDHVTDDDIEFRSEGIKLIVASGHIELLKDTLLDYVELEPGQFNFIFLNPNDPNYSPPSED